MGNSRFESRVTVSGLYRTVIAKLDPKLEAPKTEFWELNAPMMLNKDEKLARAPISGEVLMRHLKKLCVPTQRGSDEQSAQSARQEADMAMEEKGEYWLDPLLTENEFHIE